MSRYLIDRIAANERVELATSTHIRELVGDTELEAVVVERSDGLISTLPVRAVFALLGAQPRTEWMPHTIERDAHGFLMTGEGVSAAARGASAWTTLARTPAPLETSVPGVFAVGDVRAGSVKRVAAAVGEGASASRLVHERLMPTA